MFFLKTIIYKIFSFFLCNLTIMIVLALKKIIIIRFGDLETRAIGHFGLGTEIYLSEQKILSKKKIFYDIWIKDKKVANYFLLKKLKEKIKIFPHHFKDVYKFFKKKSKLFKAHLIPMRHPDDYSDRWPKVTHQMRDVNSVLGRTKCNIEFSSEENRLGNLLLKKLNIKNNFIIFFSRDSTYRDKKLITSAPRNSSILLQKKSIKRMSKNYFCIRMGSKTEFELKIKSKNFLDYSFSKYRSEFNDLFLVSNCKFLVSTGSGFDHLAILFRKPVVLVNAVETEYRYNPLYNSSIKIFIPKKIYSKKLERLLTFSEIFKIGAHNLQTGEDYEKRSLFVIDNDEEEILQTVIEMDNLISNKIEYTKSEENLQKKYWDLNKLPNMPKFSCRIGTYFLKKNIELLK